MRHLQFASNPCRGDGRKRLEPVVSVVFSPAGEQDWTYCHHPHIQCFKGCYYALWSSSQQDEDAPGQRVMMALSKDGIHWEEPTIFAEPEQGECSLAVLTAAGFHQYNDMLVAYYASYEVDSAAQPGERLRNAAAYARSSCDGRNWSGPIDLQLPIVPNHAPQRTATGRLIMSGHTMFPYTDDPYGLSGWQLAGIYAHSAERWLPLRDDPEAIALWKARTGWEGDLCEGSWFQLPDGTLRMFLRSNTNYLFAAESSDNGCTWSFPLQTAFTDNWSKFHFGQLPDGRFYYVGNPDPEPRWRRNPLVLAISRDGLVFDEQYVLGDEERAVRYPGLYKGGDYGYPHSTVHNGRLSIIYSICKENIAVMNVSLARLKEREDV